MFVPNQANNVVQPLSYSLQNGDKVMYGAGNMPCIKPDMNFHKTMPNINYNGAIQLIPNSKETGQIPNGSKLN